MQRVLVGLVILVVLCSGVGLSHAYTLVFDSITGATVSLTGSTPRMFMGQGFNMADPGSGAPVTISKLDIVLASATAQAYTDVQLQVQFWDTASGATSGTSTVFSNALGSPMTIDLGAQTFTANSLTTFSLTLPSTVTFTNLDHVGVAFNWQGDTGSGLASTNNLTTGIRGGSTAPAPAVGAFFAGSPPSTRYYRAASRTDLNFLGSDARSVGNNSGLAFRLYTGSATAVTMVAFTATPGTRGGTQLTWQTGFEVDNLGFHLYREQGSQRLRITPQLLAGSALLVGRGTPIRAGHTYTWFDEAASGATPARYWLEDIDLSGQSTWHGPVTSVPATAPGPAARQAAPLSSLGHGATPPSLSAPVERRASFNPLPTVSATSQDSITAQPAVSHVGDPMRTPAFPPPSSLAGQAALKLMVRAEGWYRVTQPELVAAGLPPHVNPRLLQLYVDGRQVPIRISGEENGQFDRHEAIEFYGLGLDASWTDARVYWLVVGTTPGQRIPQVVAPSGQDPARQGAATARPQVLAPGRQDPARRVPVPPMALERVPSSTGSARSFLSTVEQRPRTIYFSALRNGEQENFFGAVVSPQPIETSLLVQHLDPMPPGSTVLRVALQGVTQGRHHVEVTLNGVSVGTVTWQDKGLGVASLVIAPSLLREGQNRLTLTAEGETYDVSLVESLRLTYWHTYTADNDALRFSATGGQQVTVGGFSSATVRVMDITEADAVREVSGALQRQGEQFAVSLTVPGNGPRILLAFTPGQAQVVAAITANQPSSWRQPGHAADLVIISHRDFLGSIGTLQALRQSQGLRVAVVDVEDLYDEFSYGHKTPYAVQDFLRYATTQWASAPRFVLFAGHASYDPKDYLGLGDSDFVPTKLIDTALMETASDDWFVDFHVDGLPKLAVGRLPVRTAQDAERLVAKILSYEATGGGSGVLLVAGRNDGFDFEGANAQLMDLLPAYVVVEEIARGQMDDATAKRQLFDSLNRGPALVNYAGHGSVTLWGGSLFTADDAHTLRNHERLSVMVSMTCLNGYAHDPALASLAESLLSAEGGGVAVWASSGMTGATEQTIMNQELYRLLLTESDPNGASPTLGEAVVRAKAVVSDGDIRRTWMLLGDPTMKLKLR